jgi:hypothetical protein
MEYIQLVLGHWHMYQQHMGYMIVVLLRIDMFLWDMQNMSRLQVLAYIVQVHILDILMLLFVMYMFLLYNQYMMFDWMPVDICQVYIQYIL